MTTPTKHADSTRDTKSPRSTATVAAVPQLMLDARLGLFCNKSLRGVIPADSRAAPTRTGFAPRYVADPRNRRRS